MISFIISISQIVSLFVILLLIWNKYLLFIFHSWLCASFPLQVSEKSGHNFQCFQSLFQHNWVYANEDEVWLTEEPTYGLKTGMLSTTFQPMEKEKGMEIKVNDLQPIIVWVCPTT